MGNISYMMQILGTGNQRILYLTHRIHLRRFTAALCSVLKTQPEKQCVIEDFPERYSEVSCSVPSGISYLHVVIQGSITTVEYGFRLLLMGYNSLERCNAYWEQTYCP